MPVTSIPRMRSAHMSSAHSSSSKYMLLAPSVPLLLRGVRRCPCALLLGPRRMVAGLSAVGCCSFSALSTSSRASARQRKPSLVGVPRLRGLSAAALTLAITSILIRDSRWTTYVVVVAGGIGVAVAAALDSVTGLIVACLALTLIPVIGSTARLANRLRRGNRARCRDRGDQPAELRNQCRRRARSDSNDRPRRVRACAELRAPDTARLHRLAHLARPPASSALDGRHRRSLARSNHNWLLRIDDSRTSRPGVSRRRTESGVFRTG